MWANKFKHISVWIAATLTVTISHQFQQAASVFETAAPFAWTFYTSAPHLLSYNPDEHYPPNPNAYIPPPAAVLPPQQPTTTWKPITQRPPTQPATTEFVLPEVIDNRLRQKVIDSGYPTASRPNPVYLPSLVTTTTPSHDEDENSYRYEPPSGEQSPILPPVQTVPSNVYLPATATRSQTKPKGVNQLPADAPSTFSDQPALRLALNQMRCLAASVADDDSGHSGYFKALLTVQSPQTIEHTPVIDQADGFGTEPTDDNCGVRLLKSSLIVIDVPADRFDACGVISCANHSSSGDPVQRAQHLCLRLRFPQIASMWTAADPMLTLQCHAQAAVADRTHSLRLAVQPHRPGESSKQVGRGRSNASGDAGVETRAHGGSQLPLHTDISLARIRTTPTTVIEPLASNGAVVRLGDELLLRTQLNAGVGGWNFTRMADVRLQQFGGDDGRTIVHSAELVDSDGCVPAAMRNAVCPDGPPVFERPLGQRFRFRAVMFRGMRNGDEMVLSVRVVGCLRMADCWVDTEQCDLPDRKRRRNRRHIDENADNVDVARISFRVEMPQHMSVPDDDVVDEDDVDVVPRQLSTSSRHSVKGTKYGGMRNGSAVHPVGFVAIFATLALIVLALIIGLYVRRR